jgi:hypothetical protein
MTTVRELRELLYSIEEQDAEVRGHISMRTSEYIAVVWEKFEDDKETN